jgi:hypothetical protein
MVIGNWAWGQACLATEGACPERSRKECRSIRAYKSLHVEVRRHLRIILYILLVVPVGLFVYVTIINPIGTERNSLRELAFLACGMPVLFTNLFLWLWPNGPEPIEEDGAGQGKIT